MFHVSTMSLRSLYPAITPKYMYLISTSVAWSIGLIITRNMVISSCHLKATNGLKNAPEAISEDLKFQNFLGGMPPDPPRGNTGVHSPFAPQNFL